MNRQHPFALAVPVSAIDHYIGPAHAPVTVVEYGDFECPNCKQAAPAVRMLLERCVNRIRFVYRHFPLEEVHPNALSAGARDGGVRATATFFVNGKLQDVSYGIHTLSDAVVAAPKA